ncbi:class I SAM-dependent methyltransferase [Nocardia gipuzkoensis]|uniref:class I SAM-dependent methyltransferase n=1 Tax=Nocardia gipuzkoensis TaxID=2749991 RepID=UPI00237E9B07|nr:class I SAM-dependent methyltransferase [Nocardia gipuzkoensis]MDE1669679.1 class I SAM-dependent methyltransferase [Nocardia gipuzkoensis]
MSETPARAPEAGVAMTAIGVAVIRAWESRRPDRLYDDPAAQLFVDAANRSLGAGPDGAARWARLEALAEQFYAGRSVSVRLVDDDVETAVAAGCRQLVILGAGLDTRAYRLSLPEEVDVFEIDLPELFAFKEPVLAAANARPVCGRHVVAADLREDWAGALRANGFRADVPTHWVDEGVLGYLLREDAMRVVRTLTDLSAPGSHFGLAEFDTTQHRERYTELQRLVLAGGRRAAGTQWARTRRRTVARRERMADRVPGLGRSGGAARSSGRPGQPGSRTDSRGPRVAARPEAASGPAHSAICLVKAGVGALLRCLP